MFRQCALFAGVASLGLLISTPAWAVKDQLTVTGLATSPGGFTPTLNGSPSEYFYAFTVPAGASVSQTIPVQFDLANTDGLGNTFTVSMTGHGPLQNAGSLSYDLASFSMTAPSSVTHYVYLSTASLTAGNYVGNVQIDATPASGVTIAHTTLHLRIHVVPADGAASCDITDSSGLLLTDCASGNPVPTGGEFLIVNGNKTKITATNPGQFYYNLLWTNNTGAPVTFTSLGLTSYNNNTLPQGTNAVHVLIYNATSFTASFDDVNKNGTPCGTSGAICKSPIVVPDGQTLWLTWHVAYSLIGKPAPADLLLYTQCPTTPGTDAIISLSATLTSDQVSPVSCGPVTANGYKVY